MTLYLRCFVDNELDCSRIQYFIVFSRFLSRSIRSNEFILSIPSTAPLRPVLPFVIYMYIRSRLLNYLIDLRERISLLPRTKEKVKKKKKK